MAMVIAALPKSILHADRICKSVGSHISRSGSPSANDHQANISTVVNVHEKATKGAQYTMKCHHAMILDSCSR
jgi:hypothetical protein